MAARDHIEQALRALTAERSAKSAERARLDAELERLNESIQSLELALTELPGDPAPLRRSR